MKRVKVSLSFFYDPESYIYEWDEDKDMSDEEILERCRNYFIDDIYDKDNIIVADMLEAEFIETE